MITVFTVLTLGAACYMAYRILGFGTEEKEVSIPFVITYTVNGNKREFYVMSYSKMGALDEFGEFIKEHFSKDTIVVVDVEMESY
jgi:hypothetical protein